MTGSVADGEDVVQETLARAYYELSQMQGAAAAAALAVPHRPQPRDRPLAARARTPREPLEAAARASPATRRSIPRTRSRGSRRCAPRSRCFLELAPAQRGCVILKDVLDHSLDEIAAELEPERAGGQGRAASRPRRAAPADRGADAGGRRARDLAGAAALRAPVQRPRLGRRARAARRRRPARPRLAPQGGRSARGRHLLQQLRALDDWHLAPAWFDGREVLAVCRRRGDAARYFIELAWRDGGVAAIRDFRYVPYIAQDGAIALDVAA